MKRQRAIFLLDNLNKFFLDAFETPQHLLFLQHRSDLDLFCFTVFFAINLHIMRCYIAHYYVKSTVRALEVRNIDMPSKLGVGGWGMVKQNKSSNSTSDPL